jgi:predicted N-acetyltransferase YhbS
VRLWPIRIGGVAALFLGPIAVDSRFRSHGLGAALVKRACEAAEASEFGAILLVGEPPFFQPLGFSIVPDGKVQLPGPVNMRRVMWRALKDGALDAMAGAVTLP